MIAGPGVYTDFTALARLRAEARDVARSAERVREVARQFEALFLQMVLESAREARLAPEAESEALGHCREMYEAQLALHLAHAGGLGLADVLCRQLGGPVDATPPASAGLTGAREEPDAAAGPEAFARALWPHAEATAARLGVVPEALLAQAALETGWGRSVIRHPGGRSSYNVFGIKAGAGWTGARMTVSTLEYEDGIPARRSAMFRAYGSYAEAFADYASLLESEPRYRAALGAREPAVFARALQQAGYATDPAYAEKIAGIAAGAPLTDALAALKESGSESDSMSAMTPPASSRAATPAHPVHARLLFRS